MASTEVIGYLTINNKRGHYYNFYPQLIRLDNQEWKTCDDEWNGKPLQLVGSSGLEFYKYAQHLSSDEVLYITYSDPRYNSSDSASLPSSGKLYFTEDMIKTCIRPASEIGFLPVLTGAPKEILRDRACQKFLKRQDNILYGPYSFQDDYKNIKFEEAGQKWREKKDATLWPIFPNNIDSIPIADRDGSVYIEEVTIEVYPEYIFLDDLEEIPAGSAPSDLPGGAASAEPEAPGGMQDHQENPPAGAEAEEPGDKADCQPEAPRTRAWMEPRELADYIYDKIVGTEDEAGYRPNYQNHRNDIMSIAINLTQNFLTVFSGEPGCGKTSICDIFAHVLGLRGNSRYVSVPVERGWTSKRDLIGYYNPLEGSIIPANDDLFMLLWNSGKMDAPALILLDEANLSPMEHYWSDFMKIADSDEGDPARNIMLCGTPLKPGNLDKKLLESGRLPPIPISDNCRFFATINNDYTTERLSPRIIDRSAVVVLPKVSYKEGAPLDADPDNLPFMWSNLTDTFGGSTEELTGKAKTIYSEISGQTEEKAGEECILKRLGISVSIRTEKAIRRFWSAAHREGIFDGAEDDARDIAALDYAIAQRLLPKIEGSGEKYRAALDGFREYCEKRDLTQCAGILKDIIKRGGGDGENAALSYYTFF